MHASPREAHRGVESGLAAQEGRVGFGHRFGISCLACCLHTQVSFAATGRALEATLEEPSTLKPMKNKRKPLHMQRSEGILETSNNL